MKVGVVTARSPSGDSGGAERFYDALVHAFRDIGHDAEEIAVPVNEATFDHILGGYMDCYDLDLSRFDIVISTKAPTYLVRHSNHVCYLVHTIRVFYDMYESVLGPGNIELRQQRELVHRMDSQALASPRCRRIFSIGEEVSMRLRHWNGLDAEVLHPPLWGDAFHEGPLGDYLFLPGRLHPWKRVDLIIKAMRHVKAPLKLLISGTGEAEEELRSLAKGDERISFLGRVDDQQLVDLYAGAFAVPFVPQREDYGYITLEAFASGKPVITCVDSGEAAAIVKHGVSGYVCEPDPEVLGAHLNQLWGQKEKAITMGASGKLWVDGLSWERIAKRLIAAAT